MTETSADEFEGDSERNNVYSVLFAPVDLSKVEDALKLEFPEAEVSIYTSGFSGSKTIRLAGNNADFDCVPDSLGSGRNSDFLLSGRISCEIAEVVEKAKRLFIRSQIKSLLGRLSLPILGSLAETFLNPKILHPLG